MKKIMILATAVLLFVSCSKKLLDFSENTYTLTEVLQSKNCDSNCGTVASCEGQNIRIKAYIDPDHIDRDHQYFYIFTHQYKKSVQVVVKNDIAQAVFDKIPSTEHTQCLIKGVVKGFDAHTNITCKRLFFIQLNSIRDLEILP